MKRKGRIMLDILISSATHRSGSTLLQRLFNARDKTLVWGENGGCLTYFCSAYDQTKHYARFKRQRRLFFNQDEDPNNWIACMTPPVNVVDTAMIETVKAFHEKLYVENYNKQHDFIGYKEVRYGKPELLLFRKCYPKGIVMLLVRNPLDIWKSLSPTGMKKEYGSLEDFTNIWNERVEHYLELSLSDPNMHLIRYEDLIQKQTNTIVLLKQIGQLENKDIERVLDKKISSTSKPVSRKIEQQVIKKCGRLMEKLGYS
ncbi:MAG TPA: sulfotransferase [Bacillales bacterium]|nr:sulfotransferase [Bacillales bacterium]